MGVCPREALHRPLAEPFAGPPVVTEPWIARRHLVVGPGYGSSMLVVQVGGEGAPGLRTPRPAAEEATAPEVDDAAQPPTDESGPRAGVTQSR